MEVPRRSRKKQRKPMENPPVEILSDEPTSVEMIDLTMQKKRALAENHFTSINGSISHQEKKLKLDLSDLSRRSQPHRAARYTDSYTVPVEASIVSDDDKQENGDCSSSGSSSEEDSDCEIIPQSPLQPLSAEEQAEWEKKVEELQKALRIEDVKLALLRKLKHSQEKKEEKKEPPTNPMPLPPHINSLNKARALKEITITTTTSATVSPTKKLMMNTNKRGPKPIQQEVKKEITISTTRSDGPMNLVMKNEKPIITIQPITVDNTIPKSTATVATPIIIKTAENVKTPSPNVTVNPQVKANQEKINKELIAQRQASAKLALRKQLEKTLLQIPRPKPPSPELHFLPNANTPQFIYYLGLDIVVDFLTKTKRPSLHSVEPFVCSECKTDFTATWRTVKIKKSSQERSVICDTCFSVTTKRSLKAEHTARLKGAFVKALQQEKEIERLSASNVPYTSSASTSKTHTIAFDTSLPSSSSSSLVNNKVASSSSSARTSAAATSSLDFFLPNSSLLNLSAFSKLTQHQLQAFIQAQAQSLITANLPIPAHLVPLSPFMPYPFHLTNKSSPAQNELQRQYLLDMIPPRRKS